jgi:hypothetical protein
VPVIPGLERLRKNNFKSKGSLDYRGFDSKEKEKTKPQNSYVILS